MLAGPGPAPNSSGSWAAAGDPAIRATVPRRTCAFFMNTIDKRPAEEVETATMRPSAETIPLSLVRFVATASVLTQRVDGLLTTPLQGFHRPALTPSMSV